MLKRVEDIELGDWVLYAGKVVSITPSDTHISFALNGYGSENSEARFERGTKLIINTQVTKALKEAN